MERSSLSSSDQVKEVDWISKLPDDVLLMILSRLSTQEAIRTSLVSKRWEDVWKHISHLVLDMSRIINCKEPLDGSNRVATLMTKVINNHRGHLESCEIHHYSYQSVNGMLNTWIQALTSVKHTKVLTLEHHFTHPSCRLDMDGRKVSGYLDDISPNVFSHPSLKSLSLHSYILKSSYPLSYCPNLKTLKLLCIVASDVGVFNRVLASCPSLEVLVLNISCSKKIGGPLKIENSKLKLLEVMCSIKIDGIRVSVASLDILAIYRNSLRRDEFSLTAPKLQFNRNFWVAGRFFRHISYNISEEKIVHEEFVNLFGELAWTASLSVSVDLMNLTQVERLRQVLRLWNTHQMLELEILFKNNDAPRKEGESCSQKKLWEENNNNDPFPNAEFRVSTVWMHNFSGSEEEFAFASCLIRQGTVLNNMMIKSTSFPATKKLKIEAAVAKLQALQTTEDQWDLVITCF
ncbi:hypothetical protein EUTSA_v10019621mg [Eutrema salsugineum]|uniref:F-box domain-containing protein n=2 Tax=Eutrema salsugineum TaxID=72664 RepID=V4KBN4_EUTSA|nr:hypothetical protein EUTSA_v10019621mg [Eutrema salsugineum]